MPNEHAISELKRALHADDAPGVRAILGATPVLRSLVNRTLGPFDSPAIVHARSRSLLDALLDAGADINTRSTWWAGGFGILDLAPREVALYAIDRGARVDAHSAARLGLVDELRGLLDADPGLINSRGGDGQFPLHFACSAEVADILLDRGADIDARDIDHESTAAQHMVKARQDVARHLVARGGATDLLMASAIGDLALVRRILDADPDAVRTRVSDEWFAMLGAPSTLVPGRKCGGTIYQWELGWHVSAHQVARSFGHAGIFDELVNRSPPDVRLIVACWLGDAPTVESLLSADPRLPDRLSASDRRQLAHAARNNDTSAARLMLRVGLPIDALTQHQATALHWASFHGNAELVESLIMRGAPLEPKDHDHGGTPLDWAVFGSENGWSPIKGDYGVTVRQLLRAGARRPREIAGSAEVRAAFVG